MHFSWKIAAMWCIPLAVANGIALWQGNQMIWNAIGGLFAAGWIAYEYPKKK